MSVDDNKPLKLIQISGVGTELIGLDEAGQVWFHDGWFDNGSWTKIKMNTSPEPTKD